MKKLLIILMVVAMAAFLFVGCMPGVTPDVDEDDEDEDDEVLASATPVMTDVQTSAGVSFLTVTSTSTQYMNKTELGNSILVIGTNAPPESSVQIYLDDVAIAGAVGEATVTGSWSVAVAKSSLGADGVGKVLHATVTEVGLAESAASNSVTFTLDTDAPGFSIAATAGAAESGTATDSAVATVTSGVNPVESIALDTDTDTDVVPGTWTIYCTGDSVIAAGSSLTNVEVTTPAGVTTEYQIELTNLTYGFITGFDTKLDPSFQPGDGCDVVVTEDGVTAAIIARATITFDEDVSHAAMAVGTYTTIGDPTTYKEATDTGYWNATDTTALAPGDAGDTYTITAYGIADLAGNVGGTSTSLLTASCTVGAASTTSLAP